jgi:hypothetical protein
MLIRSPDAAWRGGYRCPFLVIAGHGDSGSVGEPRSTAVTGPFVRCAALLEPFAYAFDDRIRRVNMTSVFFITVSRSC